MMYLTLAVLLVVSMVVGLLEALFQLPELPHLVDFLSFIAGPAGTAAVFVFISDLVRNQRENGGFAGWTSLQVQLFMLGITLAIPVVGYVILTFVPAATLVTLEPIWAILGTWALAYLIQNGVFKIAKAAGKTTTTAATANSYIVPEG